MLCFVMLMIWMIYTSNWREAKPSAADFTTLNPKSNIICFSIDNRTIKPLKMLQTLILTGLWYLLLVKVEIDIFNVDPLHKIVRKFHLRHATLMWDLSFYIPVATGTSKWEYEWSLDDSFLHYNKVKRPSGCWENSWYT